MRRANPWDLLRRGDQYQGLRLLEAEHRSDPDASSIMELGVAYLWSMELQRARDHFLESIATFPSRMSGFYVMAGASEWCLNEPTRAIEQWRHGLEAEYADTAGLGIDPALMLYFASVVKPCVCRISEADHLLRVKADDPRISGWWGPVAQFVLGEIGENALWQASKGDQPHDLAPGNWLAGFWVGVVRLRDGNTEAFQSAMRRAANAPESFDEDAFLTCLWHAEFFLARHEAASISRK